MAFQQAMDFDAAGTPRLGRVASFREEEAERAAAMAKPAPKTRSVDAGGPSEETLSLRGKDDDGILPLFSPDQQSLPTRTINWAGRDSFSGSVGEDSCFFPAEVSTDQDDESDESDDSEASYATTIFKSHDFLARHDARGMRGDSQGESLFSPRGSLYLLSRSSRPAPPRRVRGK